MNIKKALLELNNAVKALKIANNQLESAITHLKTDPQLKVVK